MTVTVTYCVTGPDECSAPVAKTISTPVVFSLPTVALAPLAGTCGVAQQYPGEWLTDQNCSATGDWVVAPAKVEVLCKAAGASYPAFPAGNPTPLPWPDPLSSWYLTTDQKWFRTPSVGSAGNATIPTCQ